MKEKKDRHLHDEKHGGHGEHRHHAEHQDHHEHHDRHDHHDRHEHDGEDLLSVKNLVVEYTSGRQIVHAVNDVSFELKKGESLGVVGESGCGKSTIAKAILRILPDHGARIAGGEMWYKGCDVASIPEKEMEHIRGAEISMIFQDPMTALNPVKRIIDQISGVIRLHNPGMSRREAEERGIKMLNRVGISKDRVRDYPHQFSGGMQQRVEVAIGLSCNPDLLLADEPTTALDVTIQAQVLDLIRDLMEERGTTLLLITHNLGIIAEMCDYVAVLYGGEIVEYGSKREIFKDPRHPYTIGLFGAVPSLTGEGERLKPVEGIMPEPSDLPTGCKFHTRCPYAEDRCRQGFTPGMEDEWATGPDGFAVTISGKSFVPGIAEANREQKQKISIGAYTWQESESIQWTLTLNEMGYTLAKSVRLETAQPEADDEGEEYSVVEYSGKQWNGQGNAVYCSMLSGVIPTVELGGTHTCQCCNLEAVKAAREKEGVK